MGMNGCGSSLSWYDKVLIFLVLIAHCARLILIHFWVFHIILPIEFHFLLHSVFHTLAGIRMTWSDWLLKHRLMHSKQKVSDSFDLGWGCRICILYLFFPGATHGAGLGWFREFTHSHLQSSFHSCSVCGASLSCFPLPFAFFALLALTHFSGLSILLFSAKTFPKYRLLDAS